MGEWVVGQSELVVVEYGIRARPTECTRAYDNDFKPSCRDDRGDPRIFHERGRVVSHPSTVASRRADILSRARRDVMDTPNDLRLRRN